MLLTVGHLGFFEFRVGDFSNSKTAGDSTGRLKGQLLKVIDGHHKDDTKFRVTKHGRQLYKMKLVLPPNLTCERCVMQWWYTAGNNPGYKQETVLISKSQSNAIIETTLFFPFNQKSFNWQISRRFSKGLIKRIFVDGSYEIKVHFEIFTLPHEVFARYFGKRSPTQMRYTLSNVLSKMQFYLEGC